MKTTRRGFAGIVGGAVAAAVLPMKELLAQPVVEEVAEPITEPVFQWEKPKPWDGPFEKGHVLLNPADGSHWLVTVGEKDKWHRVPMARQMNPSAFGAITIIPSHRTHMIVGMAHEEGSSVVMP